MVLLSFLGLRLDDRPARICKWSTATRSTTPCLLLIFLSTLCIIMLGTRKAAKGIARLCYNTAWDLQLALGTLDIMIVSSSVSAYRPRIQINQMPLPAKKRRLLLCFSDCPTWPAQSTSDRKTKNSHFTRIMLKTASSNSRYVDTVF